MVNTSPSRQDSLKVATRSPQPDNETSYMSLSRHLFTSQETSILLKKAKSLGVIISQLAQAVHLVALFSMFPADKSNKVSCCGLVNARTYAQLSPPYYGNATAPYMGTIDCNSFSPSILKGAPLESATDVQLIYQIAIDLANLVKEYIDTALNAAYAVDLFVTEIRKTFDFTAPSSGIPLDVMSDGSLDRYIQHQYTGRSTSIRVLDAHLILQDPSPIVQVRSSTFDNRLSLSLSYNTYCYNKEEVGEMSKGWSKTLQFVVKMAKKARTPDGK